MTVCFIFCLLEFVSEISEKFFPQSGILASHWHLEVYQFDSFFVYYNLLVKSQGSALSSQVRPVYRNYHKLPKLTAR